MKDPIERQDAIDAVNNLVDRFERILRDIREANVDESVCRMCEYDGAYMGQSGDWCNECPGFDKADCFKLSDRCRKRWINETTKELPSAQPDVPDTNVGDTVSRQAAIDVLCKECSGNCIPCGSFPCGEVEALQKLPSAQPCIIRCKGCRYWWNKHLCKAHSIYGTYDTKESDFCSRAEKREDE